MTFATPVNLRATLNLDDRFSPGLRSASGALGNFESGLGRVGRGTGQLAQGFARVGAIAGTALVGGIVASVKVAADFEEQLRTINTIALATDPALNEIGLGIRKLAVEHGGDLNDLTTAYYDLLSAGIAVADAQGVLNQATLLSIGTLGTTSQAVDVLTTALNAYGLSGSEAGRISEELAVAVRDGKVTLDQIAPVYANVAAIAAQAGIGTDEIAASFGRLTAQGVDAAAVTTQMSRAIVELLKPSAELTALQKETGIVFADVARDQGLVQALELMRQKAEALGIPFINLFGRVEAYKFALQTTGPAHQAFLDELAEVQGASGVLAEQVGAREKGLAFQFNKLKASIREVGIVIGSALLPELTPLFTDFALFVTSKAPQIEEFAQNLAKGFRDFVAEIKKTDFSGFLGGLGLMVEIGGKVVDLFRALPPGVQALAITGLALNKLSGGLLGAGVGNIARGLIQVVFQRGTTPANPLWVASVGGVGGGIGTAGGGGGGITTLLGVLGAALGGLAIGTVVGNELIRPQIEEAATFELSAFDRLRLSGDSERLRDAINAISLELNPSDIGAQVALALDIQGVRTTLEEQRETLRNLLTTQELQSHLVRETSSTAAADRQQGTQFLANLAAAVPRASAQTLAALGVQAHAVRESGARTAGLLGNQGGTLRAILAKPESFVANTTVNTNVSVSASAAQTAAYQWAAITYATLRRVG